MALYSFFRLRESELVAPFNRNYREYLDALDAARGLCEDHTVEVCDENRFVARVKEDDGAPEVKDRPAGDRGRPQKSPPFVGDEQEATKAVNASLRESIHRSDRSLAATSEAFSRSRNALDRSRALLDRINKKGKDNG